MGSTVPLICSDAPAAVPQPRKQTSSPMQPSMSCLAVPGCALVWVWVWERQYGAQRKCGVADVPENAAFHDATAESDK